MRFLTSTLAAFLLGQIPAMAAEGGEHHALPMNAQPLSEWLPITNSTIMIWISVGLIVLFCRIATHKVALIPAGVQNFAEAIIEGLYNFLEGLLGAHLVKRCFWFLGSVFFFIITTNWLGLLPGVGTVGFFHEAEGHTSLVPFLRGGNADLNMTSAMALTFAALWFYWALTENSVKGFFAHIFAPKGEFKGGMLLAMIPVFLFVGVLELVSIAIRPVALSFRLFGNIYGGEQTLESLMALVPKQLAFAPSLPFYFMELLVGGVQALVFTLLCSIFIKLICDHGDDHGDDHAH
jgi:F-type H+-transporting ATPase subunit a